MAPVLLVDDDPILRMAIALAFESAGWRVRMASDGAEALLAFDSEIPALVVTDIVMPNEDGIGLIRSVKRAYPFIPIIAVSGRPWLNGLDVFDLATELGADAVLQKPFAEDALVALAADLLHAQPVRDEISA